MKARMKEAAALKKTYCGPPNKRKRRVFMGLPSKEYRRPWRWLTKCLRPWAFQEVETSPSYRQQNWKEMTITSINTSCKQFNKMCFCYPAINTSWHPSTPHKGVDGVTRPVNNTSLPSREASLLCKELGANHSGPMGSAGNNGVQIRPAQDPHQEKRPAVLHHALITEEVQELLAKQAIREAQIFPNSFISQLFLVEKKGGRQRPVINLKALNSFVRSEHFKMEGLHILPDIIQTGDYMIKLDLKDAYLQIPIHQDHQHLLQFQWEEKTYQFMCFPIGLTSAPRVFTKVLKPPLGVLRQMGIRLVVYLDDILILHQSREELECLAPLICSLFEALGLVINTKNPY